MRNNNLIIFVILFSKLTFGLKNWLRITVFFDYKTPILLSWCFIFFSGIINAQINLIQNPSFEDTIQCPNFYKQINYAIAWDTLKAGGGGTPELFSNCSNFQNISVPINIVGFQYPHSGNNYSGLGLFAESSNPNREYIQNKLSKKLQINTSYCISIYVSLANISTTAIDQIGIYLDAGNINTPYFGISTLTPQIQSPIGVFLTDTSGWQNIRGLYSSNGTEEYLTIGNFKTNAQTNTITVSNGFSESYYLIDDVSVIEANSKANAGQDTLICIGDSVFIGRQQEVGLQCDWYNNSAHISNGTGIWVKPNTDQQYIVKQDVCGILSYDTIQVSIKDIDCNAQIKNTEIPNTFTPNGDNINDVWQFSFSKGTTLNEFEIYNRWGNIIHQKTDNSFQTTVLWDGRTTSGEPCNDGVYFYVLKYIDAKGNNQITKGSINLFR